MGYHPRIETTNIATFSTTRSRNSELWFINNPELEQTILGYLAKFQKRYKVKLYAFAIEGNHIHDTAMFPEANRSHFMRDLNSCIARAVPRTVSSYPGGRFWGRRYSAELVPDPLDIERQFFYTVLQPVIDGHVDRIADYQGYNCFRDAVSGFTRKFKIMNWTKYYEAKRKDPTVRRLLFLEEYELKYERLPGYEQMSQRQYRQMMCKKLSQHEKEIRKKRGKGAAGVELIKKKPPGSRPIKTKTSKRFDRRPRIICRNLSKQRSLIRWYFSILLRHRQASLLYRCGALDTAFPPGTYRPPTFTMRYTVPVMDLLM